MKRVIVASRNPVKIAAVRQGLAQALPHLSLDVQGVDVPSGVPDQPMTDAQTLAGAQNRAHNARQLVPDADLYAGVEGGVDSLGQTLLAFAWIVLLSPDGRTGRSRTATFELPPKIAHLLHQGVELGHADDQVFGRQNSKQHNGAVGLLTHDLIDRTAYYQHAVILAAIPFLQPDHYPAP